MTTTTTPAEEAVPSVGPDRFRAVLGHFPTGVVVVTGTAGGRPVGMTVGSFFSLSLQPPLVGFAVDHGSHTWPLLQASGTFCINVLAEHQAGLASWFAKRGVDRFGHVGWARSPGGTPILDGAVAWMDCELYAVHSLGDHNLVAATVCRLDADESSTGPLLFYRRAYGGFRPIRGSPVP